MYPHQSPHQSPPVPYPLTALAPTTSSPLNTEHLSGLAGVLSFDGVPPGATEKDLSVAVSHFGEAVRVVLLPHHGVAFVQMRTAEQVRWGSFCNCVLPK